MNLFGSAGDKMEICIEAENGAGRFGWYFISEGDYDIGFSVSVEEKDADGPVEVRKYDKLITDQVRIDCILPNLFQQIQGYC